MNRRELVRAVAAHTSQDVKQVESVLSGVTDVITAVVSKGEAVTVQGFAKFAKVERAARIGRNPRTGEQIRIKASKRVRLSPMKAFKDTVMAPASAPKLERGVWPTSPELLARQAADRKATTPAPVRTPRVAAAAAKAPAKKAPAAAKAPAKKAPVKAVVKKAPVKKAPAVKAPAKKAPAAAKAPAKKAPVRKAVAKKATR
jgi:DNA-binding protein HU-beta